jgi:hypothetical protein
MSTKNKNSRNSGNSQTSSSLNANALRGLSVGERISYQGNPTEVRQLVNQFTEKNPAYDYNLRSNKGTVVIERRAPENLYRRSLYVQSITKSNLVGALKQNQWVKERTATAFGVSARTIGRMMSRHSVSAPRA